MHGAHKTEYGEGGGQVPHIPYAAYVCACRCGPARQLGGDEGVYCSHLGYIVCEHAGSGGRYRARHTVHH